MITIKDQRCRHAVAAMRQAMEAMTRATAVADRNPDPELLLEALVQVKRAEVLRARVV